MSESYIVQAGRQVYRLLSPLPLSDYIITKMVPIFIERKAMVPFYIGLNFRV